MEFHGLYYPLKINDMHHIKERVVVKRNIYHVCLICPRSVRCMFNEFMHAYFSLKSMIILRIYSFLHHYHALALFLLSKAV